MADPSNNGQDDRAYPQSDHDSFATKDLESLGSGAGNFQDLDVVATAHAAQTLTAPERTVNDSQRTTQQRESRRVVPPEGDFTLFGSPEAAEEYRSESAPRVQDEQSDAARGLKSREGTGFSQRSVGSGKTGSISESVHSLDAAVTHYRAPRFMLGRQGTDLSQIRGSEDIAEGHDDGNDTWYDTTSDNEATFDENGKPVKKPKSKRRHPTTTTSPENISEEEEDEQK